jgi:hypothetical protein
MKYRLTHLVSVFGLTLFVCCARAQSIPGSWHRVALPHGSHLPVNDNLRDFGFRDSLYGFAASSYEVLSYTTNGGHEWLMDTDLNASYISKRSLNDAECTGPRHGIYHDFIATIIENPSGSYVIMPPRNEPNFGQYTTLAEKMYDTSYGFRLGEYLSVHDLNDYQDSVVILVTHDAWQSSELYGSAYILDPAPHNTKPAVLFSGTIVDSNDIWFAKGAVSYPGVIVHTSNSGSTWETMIPIDTTKHTPFFRSILVDRTTNEVFCLGTGTGTSTDKTDFAYSNNYGLTWTVDSTFGITMWRLQNPAPSILWAMVSAGAVGNIYIEPIADIHSNPKAYSRKLAYSSDNGRSWIIDSTTFANDYIEELHFTDARHGWVATWSNDSTFIWYYDADGVASVAKESQKTEGLTIYPNPTTQSTTITFTPESPGRAEIAVVNMLGVEVARVFSGAIDRGEHTFTWDPPRRASGMYECIVRMNGKVQVVPVVVE